MVGGECVLTRGDTFGGKCGNLNSKIIFTQLVNVNLFSSSEKRPFRYFFPIMNQYFIQFITSHRMKEEDQKGLIHITLQNQY